MDIESLANLANVIRFIERHGSDDPPVIALDQLLLEWLAGGDEPESLASGIQAGCESGVLECVAPTGALCVQLTAQTELPNGEPRPLVHRLPVAPAWPDRSRRPRASELLQLSKDRQSA